VAVDKNTGVVQFVSKGHWELFATNPDPKDNTIFTANRDGKVFAIRPVLREGEVGTVVMDLRPEPLAAAR